MNRRQARTRFEKLFGGRKYSTNCLDTGGYEDCYELYDNDSVSPLSLRKCFYGRQCCSFFDGARLMKCIATLLYWSFCLSHRFKSGNTSGRQLSEDVFHEIFGRIVFYLADQKDRAPETEIPELRSATQEQRQWISEVISSLNENGSLSAYPEYDFKKWF